MLNVSLKQVKAIFHEQRVASKMQTATAKALKRAGAFVQRTARRSMRKGGRPSAPGKPPKVRKGQLKRFLFFVVDREAESVVVGPVKLTGAEDAPSVLEHGGNTERTVFVKAGARKRVSVKYEPRPFMGPALTKEQTNLPKLWEDAFK